MRGTKIQKPATRNHKPQTKNFAILLLRSWASASQSLAHDKPDEGRVADQISPPQTTRLLRQAMEPLKSAALHPPRGAACAAPEVIKASSDTKSEPDSGQREVRGDPVLLCW
jgi:hypothetical protein